MAARSSKPRSQMSAAERKRSDAAKRSAETRQRAREGADAASKDPGTIGVDGGERMAQLERSIVRAIEAGLASMAPQPLFLSSNVSEAQFVGGEEPHDDGPRRQRERDLEEKAAHLDAANPSPYIGDGPIAAAMSALHDEVQMLSEEAWNLVHAVAPILDPAEGVEIDPSPDSAVPVADHIQQAAARIATVRRLLAHTRGRVAL